MEAQALRAQALLVRLQRLHHLVLVGPFRQLRAAEALEVLAMVTSRVKVVLGMSSCGLIDHPIRFIDVSFQEVVNRMVEFQNVTNLNKIPYWPLGPNSNSYTFTFIESLGFYRVGADLMVPGHGHGTPSNKLSYFSP